MERETGIEPATSSLGIRQSIGNKEYSVSWHLVLAIENYRVFTLGSLHGSNGAQTEHTNGNGINALTPVTICNHRCDLTWLLIRIPG